MSRFDQDLDDYDRERRLEAAARRHDKLLALAGVLGVLLATVSLSAVAWLTK